MERLSSLTLLLTLTGCSACSTVGGPIELPGIPFEIDPTLALSTSDGGAGHACPVEGVVLTAAHVMWRPMAGRFVGATYTHWGEEGYARVLAGSTVKDIVALEVSGSITYLPRGKVEPGEMVFWFEYDFLTRKNALRARRRVSRVLRIVAGLVVVEDAPVPGASGSCLISERGEVVGIVTSAFETLDGHRVGVAVTLPPPELLKVAP